MAVTIARAADNLDETKFTVVHAHSELLIHTACPLALPATSDVLAYTDGDTRTPGTAALLPAKFIRTESRLRKARIAGWIQD